MSCGEIHVGDENVTFTFTVMEDCAAINISTATVKELIFRKPNGTSVTQTASFSTDGTDGDIKYVTIAGDLDEPGIWRVQAEVTLGAGSYYHSEIQKFKVLANV
jgi:hypothetical protein